METSTAVKALSGGTVGVGVLGASGYGIHTLSTNSNKPKTIGDQLRWENRHPLPTQTSNTSKDTKWNTLVQRYESASDKLDTLLDLSGVTGITLKINKLKKGCEDFLNKNLTGSDKSNLAKAQKWCTEESDQLKVN